MPTINVKVEQKRPIDATPERALAMYEEGHLKQTEIAKLWGVSKSRVCKLILKARAQRAVKKALAGSGEKPND